MRLPPSFELTYWVEYAAAAEIEKFAGAALQNEVSAPKHWLYAGRLKTGESALAKLELSPVRSLATMQDLYAATVVVPTRNEITSAIEAVSHAFPDHRVVRRRQGDPESFVYDDVHVIAKLGQRVAAFAATLADRPFEIQIRTGLQFAWWRATHDVLYKGEPGSWRLRRVASQTRATLELLDVTLANLRRAAELLDTAGPNADAEAERRAAWVGRWPHERRPENVVRFATAAGELLDAAATTLDQAEALLASERAKELLTNVDLTPFQVLLALVIEDRGPAVVGSLPERRRVLVTDELVHACSRADEISDSRRATP